MGNDDLQGLALHQSIGECHFAESCLPKLLGDYNFEAPFLSKAIGELQQGLALRQADG